MALLTRKKHSFIKFILTEFWILQTVIVHIFLLGSIFVIYFRSPIIRGLQPQANILNPPAKRLVLMVADGLRAESFFEERCDHIPSIRNLFLQKGILGISHTRVPTESRPGHIALIAGLYEDPSAVTRGWKDNPIDFDSVFNRSKITYAWGAYDVISIFSKCTDKHKMNIFYYDHDLDFSGTEKTYLLDTWVFDRVKAFIERNAEKLKSESRMIFFLHLLGLDSAGHIHKPGTSLFYENLNITEHGIIQIYELFEKAFNDNRTAYILTADHGMTDAGSHGSGHFYETETPFFIWGAGIHNWKSLDNNIISSLAMKRCNVPIFEVEQASFAPLMAALIGVASPMNNFGILPTHFLNTSSNYKMKVFLNNALQIMSQYEWLHKDFKKGLFSKLLPNFERLQNNDIYNYKMYTSRYVENLDFPKTIHMSEEMMSLALEGIEYYQTYYKTILLFATTVAFLGWILYLLLLLQGTEKENNNHTYCFVGVICSIIFSVIYLQRIPFAVGIYFLFPIFCWIPNLNRNIFSNLKLSWHNLEQIFIILIGAELLVSSFYSKEMICLALLGSSVIQARSILKKPFTLLFYQWIISLILLATFPFYSLSKNDSLLYIGIIFSILRAYHHKLYNNKLCLSFSVIAITNFALCVFLNNNFIAIPSIFLIINWILAAFSFVAPLLSKTIPQERIRCVFHYLGTIYMLLSISYEFLFLELLAIHLLASVELRKKAFKKETNEGTLSTNTTNISEHFRLSFSVLLFTLLSFFGTGNTASISSFDPNIVRCFVTTFSPFTIMSLVILKLTIPGIILVSIISNSFQSKGEQRNVFISLLLICEIMGLNFLFMVTNKGSWLEIGASISHFVIMEVTTVVFLIIYYISKWLNTYSIF